MAVNLTPGRSGVDMVGDMELQTPMVKFISVRRWQAGAEWRPRPHSHGFCEIVVVLRGVERVQVDGVTILCHPGQVMFYPPDCVHRERQYGDALLEFLCLNFEWTPCPTDMPRQLQDRQGRVQEVVRWLLSEDQSLYAGRERYQDAAAGVLVAELQRLVASPPEDVLSTVYEYIHDHLADPVSLDDLAHSCRLNKFYLSRLFRGRTGMTPMDYIREVRLDYAHRLLLESELPLREIAPRAGFANEYHLSRLLKQRYGRGARELRRLKAMESERAE